MWCWFLNHIYLVEGSQVRRKSIVIQIPTLAVVSKIALKQCFPEKARHQLEQERSHHQLKNTQRKAGRLKEGILQAIS